MDYGQVHLDRNGRPLRVGDRVRHAETGRKGKVLQASPSGRWVLVNWDGDWPWQAVAMPPEELVSA